MKWVNGLTEEEKRNRWVAEYYRKQAIYDSWRRWFAWYPVIVGQTPDGKRNIKAWLCYVERTGKHERRYRLLKEEHNGS